MSDPNYKALIDILNDMNKEANKRHFEVHERLNSVDQTLVKQHEQLTYHIKRTDLLDEELRMAKEKLESNLVAAKEEFQVSIDEVKKDTAPIYQHVDRMQFALKWIFKLGLPGTLLTVIGYVVKLYLVK